MVPEVERDPAEIELYDAAWQRHNAAVKLRDQAVRDEASPAVLAVLEADVVKLRSELDGTKYPQDLFNLHLKLVDQAKEKLDKLQAQLRKDWAAVATATERAMASEDKVEAATQHLEEL